MSEKLMTKDEERLKDNNFPFAKGEKIPLWAHILFWLQYCNTGYPAEELQRNWTIDKFFISWSSYHSQKGG